MYGHFTPQINHQRNNLPPKHGHQKCLYRNCLNQKAPHQKAPNQKAPQQKGPYQKCPSSTLQVLLSR